MCGRLVLHNVHSAIHSRGALPLRHPVPSPRSPGCPLPPKCFPATGYPLPATDGGATITERLAAQAGRSGWDMRGTQATGPMQAMRDRIRSAWDQLDDEDIDRTGGSLEKLVEMISVKTGQPRADVRRELRRVMRD